MKTKILLWPCFFFLSLMPAYSQWSTTGGASTTILTTGGKVGIGIGNPSSFLHLQLPKTLAEVNANLTQPLLEVGLRTTNGHTPVGAENRIIFTQQSFLNTPRVVGAIGVANGDNGNGKYGGGNLIFYTRAPAPGGGESPGLFQRMVINREGNVGIGTTNPGSFKLAVEGKIGAREIQVTTASWADFVFLKDYYLRPLYEVEEFINKNGHLPEIPSAKEVEENGINLGEMDAKLLQKIEELTLYVIELKKENEAMKEDIEKLKSLR